MSRLLLHVEGQTEETFVNDVLAPHLCDRGYDSVRARLVGNARQRDRRGGIRDWNAVRRDITNHLREDAGSFATTMVDYYGLPRSGQKAWPGRARASTLPFAEKAGAVEVELLEDIRREMGGGLEPDRFVPYVMMHEFEALILSDPRQLASQFDNCDEGIARLGTMVSCFESPEHVNDSTDTAPSKRIIREIPEYEGRKASAGPIVTERIGLSRLRSKCSHFAGWLDKLESLGPGN